MLVESQGRTPPPPPPPSNKKRGNAEANVPVKRRSNRSASKGREFDETIKKLENGVQAEDKKGAVSERRAIGHKELISKARNALDKFGAVNSAILWRLTLRYLSWPRGRTARQSRNVGGRINV